MMVYSITELKTTCTLLNTMNMAILSAELTKKGMKSKWTFLLKVCMTMT